MGVARGRYEIEVCSPFWMIALVISMHSITICEEAPTEEIIATRSALRDFDLPLEAEQHHVPLMIRFTLINPVDECRKFQIPGSSLRLQKYPEKSRVPAADGVINRKKRIRILV